MGLVSTVKERIFPGDAYEKDSLVYWQVRILSTILFSGLVLGFFVIIAVIPMAIEKKLWWLLFCDGTFWIFGVILLLSAQISYKIRAIAASTMMYAVGLAVILSVGPLSGGPVWLFGFAIIAGTLLGSRAAVFAVMINVVTICVIGFLMVTDQWGNSFPFFNSPRLMVVAGVNFIFLNALAAISVSVLVKGLTRSHKKEKRLADSLKVEIRERRQTETALRESEEKYRNILENIDDGYYEVDIAGNFIFSNDSMCQILGYSREELMGLNNREYMDKENAGKIFKVFNQVYRTGVPTKALDWQLIRKDGSECFVQTIVSLIQDSQANKTGFRGIARDVSELKQLEKQLRQAHKMESIGRLAGGIAHDFNNILYIIIGNTELTITDMQESDPAYPNLENIKVASLRAADIVKQLLNFSRDSKQELKPIDVVTLIRKDLSFLRSMIPATVDIRQNLPDARISILADRTQMNQVLMNICTNASQAMEKTGGILRIDAETILLDGQSVTQYPGLAAGSYAKITISDTGPGIAPESLDKIFDPYFTTKEIGKGSGMGLAVVHGIVKNHNGAITVSSRVGKGASFSIILPAIDIFLEIEIPGEETIPRGAETILFVDDEAFIVEMTQKILEYLGYRVETSLDPVTALNMFGSKPHAFDLVITDMAMPGMTGVGLANRVFEIRSDIPVIICTGHSSLLDQEKAKQLGIAAYVMKPVSVAELARTIRKVLDQKTL
ncbi:MAG: PAS domain S-box protein [Proteobacteria bacterium]|nr:PAS domain S-box protein [Pseudomonadota bacterium]